MTVWGQRIVDDSLASCETYEDISGQISCLLLLFTCSVVTPPIAQPASSEDDEPQVVFGTSFHPGISVSILYVHHRVR